MPTCGLVRPAAAQRWGAVCRRGRTADPRGNYHMLTNVNTGHARCQSGVECGGHAWSTDGLRWSNLTIGAFGPTITFKNGAAPALPAPRWPLRLGRAQAPCGTTPIRSGRSSPRLPMAPPWPFMLGLGAARTSTAVRPAPALPAGCPAHPRPPQATGPCCSARARRARCAGRRCAQSSGGGGALISSAAKSRQQVASPTLPERPLTSGQATAPGRPSCRRRGCSRPS